MKSLVAAVSLLSFIGVAALPTNAFARTHHTSQTHLVSAKKKSHKAAKTAAHKKAKKKTEGVPS